jgi:hypothetical protein
MGVIGCLLLKINKVKLTMLGGEIAQQIGRDQTHIEIGSVDLVVHHKMTEKIHESARTYNPFETFLLNDYALYKHWTFFDCNLGGSYTIGLSSERISICVEQWRFGRY